ncbi:MAG: histidine phosphatase family protein [Clostridia bacterium]|nr:histidine phosphatase family protein [Clostridia bacterium]
MGNAKYLYLVRHGETVANAGNIHAGQFDSPLTEKGREQAAASAPLLTGIPFDTVFSSDLSRAKDTCAIMLPDATPILRPDIREISVGGLEGNPRPAARKTYGESHLAAMKAYDYSIFGGESFADFMTRTVAFLDEVATNDAYGTHIVAFCHGGIIQSAARHILGCAENLPPLAVTNCSVSVFYFDGERWSIRTFNQTPTLPQ